MTTIPTWMPDGTQARRVEELASLMGVTRIQAAQAVLKAEDAPERLKAHARHFLSTKGLNGAQRPVQGLVAHFKGRVMHVRTQAGVERFDQPIGSVIVKDVPLVHLRSIESDYEDWEAVQDESGNVYYVGEGGEGYRAWVGTDSNDKVLVEADTEEGAYQALDEFVGKKRESRFVGMHLVTDDERANIKTKIGKPIPPAWTDVYVANDLDNAKLLVRGRDIKGRWQSMYSANHTQNQAAKKFARIKKFSQHLDKIDAALERDALSDDDAAALLLIRRLGMRPGSERETGGDKKAHGATNLRAKHVKVTPGGQTNFDFVGKKGVSISLKTKDPLIYQVISEKLQTRSRDDRLFDTDERETRDYMHSIGVPDEFLLKDLRTVVANVIALEEVAKRKRPSTPKTKTEFRRWRKEVATTVSNQLGNTPTLALSSYINPTVFDKWVSDAGWL